MSNSNMPTVLDALNITANIHNRKIIALWRKLEEKDKVIEKLQRRIEALEGLLTPLHTMGTAVQPN